MGLQVKETVVTDAEGVPVDKFSFTVNEHINVGDYSFVETSATLTRWIEDSPEARQIVIDEVEGIIGKKREEVIELLEADKS